MARKPDKRYGSRTSVRTLGERSDGTPRASDAIRGRAPACFRCGCDVRKGIGIRNREQPGEGWLCCEACWEDIAPESGWPSFDEAFREAGNDFSHLVVRRERIPKSRLRR